MNDPSTRCIELMRQRLQDPLQQELEALFLEVSHFPNGAALIETILRDIEDSHRETEDL